MPGRVPHHRDGRGACRIACAQGRRLAGARYGTTPEELAEAVRRRYGKDRTFSVPILMTSALAGLVSWREVPSLPFELACFAAVVVSLFAPAGRQLCAAGAHRHRPGGVSSSAAARIRSCGWFAGMAIGRSLRVLQAIQPSSGGFLEAAPLTSFVTLGLASIGQADIRWSAKASSSW